MNEYYIYITTNNINGKQYIGQHKGEPDDSYLGSGATIKKAIAKTVTVYYNRLKSRCFYE